MYNRISTTTVYDCCLQEVTSLSEEVAALKDSAVREKADGDAMYHLQVAQATLKERYSKLQKNNTELEKHLDQTILKLVNRKLFFSHKAF